MVTVAEVRALAQTLPRSYEVPVRDRVKFRVGSMVCVAFSHDERTMGFSFPDSATDAVAHGHVQRLRSAPCRATWTTCSGRRPTWVGRRVCRRTRASSSG